MSNAYRTTQVPIARSQEAIRKLLIHFGARGIQFSEDFETRQINIRFAKEIHQQLRTVSVTMIVPEAPQPKRRRSVRYVRGKMIYGKLPQERQEQMTRAAYRALHDWLKAQFIAVEFGLLAFEDVFLAHFEWTLPNGSVSTIGKMIKPHIEARSEFLLESGGSNESPPSVQRTCTNCGANDWTQAGAPTRDYCRQCGAIR